MSSSADDISRPAAAAVSFEDDNLVVELRDGRTISIPVSWYPRLENSSSEERSRWEIFASGSGIRWTDIDEDISIDALLEGRRSAESPSSLKRWLDRR
jgi:hypothetical protein